MDIMNESTSYGCPAWLMAHSAKSVSNAICIEQLLAVGADYVGKTKSDELAYSLMGLNEFYGTPLNPKNPDRVPGGSSSGSASAVASNLVNFAIGTDTAGSIRIPANNCGIWGYRPSHGMISTAGVLSLAPSFDTVGVVAQSGEILEKVIRVLLAENNKMSHYYPTIHFVEEVFQMANTSIMASLEPILSQITQTNKAEYITLARISDDSTVDCPALFELSAHLLSTEIYNTFGTWIENDNPQLSIRVKESFMRYPKTANRKNIQTSLCKAKSFSKKLNAFLYANNILCFPTAIDFPPKLDEITPEFLLKSDYVPRAMGVNAISGLSRTPQVTIPITEFNDIPIGLSFMAGYGQDTMLIDFCNQLMKRCFINK